MADDEAQGQQDSSGPAFDTSPGSSLLSAFDQPLVWPESTTWDEPPAREPTADPLLLGTEPPPAHGDVQWQATERDSDATVHHDQALAGLGGGAEVAAPGTDGNMGLISTTALPTPPVYPAADRHPEGRRGRRFDIRQGNAAVVGLISLVSLVLLGMFLSVRARNELSTDSSQSQRPSDEIAVNGSLNTIPPTTTAPTTAPAAGINIADLLPSLDAGAGPSGGGTAAGSGSGSAAPTAAPSGGGTGTGGGSGSPTAATQPAAQAPAPTSPAASSPTVEDSPPEETSPPAADTTQPRRPTPTFNFPGFPTTADPDPADDEPSYDFPSWSDIDD